jgi:hypothetical protein
MNKKQYKPTKQKASRAVKRQAADLADPFFAVVAEVYGVPTNGISAIDGQPYLNKDGRLYLLDALCTGKNSVRAIRSEFVKISTTAIEPSVVKKIIVFKDKEVEAIGEASQDSVNSKSVKHTLNMVAETRALNRAIWVAIGADVMKRVHDNLEKMNISDEDRARLTEAGRVSYEEMDRPTDKQVDAKASRMYEATAKRIDEISNDEEKLRRALTKVAQLPLSDEEKVLIRQRIEAKLGEFKGKMKSGRKAAKKTAKKK